MSDENCPTLDREFLGRLVRQVWVEWATEQPDPKPHWLTPYAELSEEQCEVDRRIGEKVAAVATAKLQTDNIYLRQEITSLKCWQAGLKRELAESKAEIAKLQAENGQFRDALEWLTALGHGVGKSGESPSETEWREALNVTTKLLAEDTELGKAAARAARTGSREDVAEYLRLRGEARNEPAGAGGMTLAELDGNPVAKAKLMADHPDEYWRLVKTGRITK